MTSLKTMARAGAWKAAYGVFTPLGLARGLSRPTLPTLGDIRSILAIRLDLMGDMIFTLPAINALKEVAPQARVSVLALPYTVDLLRGHPAVDRVIPVDVNQWRSPAAWADGLALRKIRESLREVRREPYDLCVSFYGRVAASFALLSGARYLVGYGEEGYPSTFDRSVPGSRYRQRRHEVEYCLDLIRSLGVPASAKPPGLALDTLAAERVARLLSQADVGPDERLVALHPGALNMAAKRWLPERWAAVADHVQREMGGRVLLVGSGSERPLVELVRKSMGTPVVALAGETSLPELVALLSRCRLFLGGDSGPLHVASALGVPSVSVYGPTDPALTGPIGSQARVVRAGVPCSPCYDPGVSAPECSRGDILCMASIQVEDVVELVRDVMVS